MMRRLVNIFKFFVIALFMAQPARAADLGLHWREAPQFFKETADRLKAPLPATIKLKYCTEATCHFDLGDGLKIFSHKADGSESIDNLWLALEPMTDKAAHAGAAKFGAFCDLLVAATQPSLSLGEIRQLTADFSPAAWPDAEREEIKKFNGVRYTGSRRLSSSPKFPGEYRLDCLATRR